MPDFMPGGGLAMNLSLFEDGSLIDKIAYRGDTRSPELIFREGL